MESNYRLPVACAIIGAAGMFFLGSNLLYEHAMTLGFGILSGGFLGGVIGLIIKSREL